MSSTGCDALRSACERASRMARHRRAWAQRLDRLDAYLHELQRQHDEDNDDGHQQP